MCTEQCMAGETGAKQREKKLMHENTGHCENNSTFQLWIWQNEEKIRSTKEMEWFSNGIKWAPSTHCTQYTIWTWIAFNKSMNHEQNFVFSLTKMCVYVCVCLIPGHSRKTFNGNCFISFIFLSFSIKFECKCVRVWEPYISASISLIFVQTKIYCGFHSPIHRLL